MKAFKKYTYLICFILPPVAILGFVLGGVANFLTPILVFLILPILDIIIGLDSTNPKEEEVPSLQNEKFYRYVTYAWGYLQLALVAWACYAVATTSLEIYELIGFTISIGLITGGIGITVGHELGHKNTKFEQFLSKMILMTVCYMHFFIEHNKGHHLNVSTKDDPATSRLNESFYTFYPRTVFGSFVSAWNIEKKRLQKQGKAVWSLANEMIRFVLITLAFAGILFGGISLITGQIQWIVLGFFFAQSWFGFSLLELVNYIEHYGLRRKEIAPGKFEKVMPVHSWNANHFVSNAFLFHLQRHSDHHANAGRRYQSLRHFEESPQLPAGYEAMILLALFPPIWKKIMNPKLEQWQAEFFKKASNEKIATY
jgi:alkane 1-monooxygenase